jgi:hypothetical protein
MTLSALHFTSFYAILSTPSINFWTLYVLVLLYFYCERLSSMSTYASVVYTNAQVHRRIWVGFNDIGGSEA